jgi:hypothetical protein
MQNLLKCRRISSLRGYLLQHTSQDGAELYQICAVCCAVLCRGLRWLPQASLIKHAFEALCINEFKGLTFELDDKGGGMKTGGIDGLCLVLFGVSWAVGLADTCPVFMDGAL